MNRAIEEFIRARRIAAVGVSTNPRKFGHHAFMELVTRGYEVVPVHPSAGEIAGIPCYPALREIPSAVEAVLVMVPAHKAMDVLQEASELGLTKVWLQQGVESPEVLALAAALGLDVVAGKCILMYAPPVGGFHRLHRTLTRLIGRL
jgi:predicted CoA-binding protein